MTNIKARGFDSPAQLREHLADLDDEIPAMQPAEASSTGDAMARRRREVAILQQQLSVVGRQVARLGKAETPDRLPLLRRAAVAVAAFLFARIVWRAS